MARTKIEGEYIFHTRSDDPSVISLNALLQVMDEEMLISLLERSKLLMAISALGSGACTIEAMIDALDSSRSSVYRSIGSIEELLPGAIIRDGGRSSLLRIDKDIPYMEKLLDLARMLHPMNIQDPPCDMVLRELTTVRSRMVLHLYQHPQTVDAYNAPVESTQRFIMKVVHTSQPVVSRELKELIKKGYLERTRSRVPGSKKRENAYILTDKGASEGRRLIERARTASVDVIDTEGIQVRVPLTEVPNKCRVRIDLCDVLYHAGKGTTVVLDRLSKEAEAFREMDFIRGLRGSSAPDDLFGRYDEIDDYLEWLKGGEGALMVIGPPGIGKTAFVSQMLMGSSPNHITFSHTLNEWSTPASFLKHLSVFLKEDGSCMDFPDRSVRVSLSLREQEITFERMITGIKIVICFDDSHKTAPVMRGFLRRILSLSGADLKIILVGREVPEDVQLSSSWRMMELKGLDLASSRSLLERSGGPIDDLDRIHELTGGNPLAIKLIACMHTRDYDDLGSLINREMPLNISVRDMELLNFLSVLRYPFPPAVLSYSYMDDGVKPSFSLESSRRRMEELRSRSILTHSGDLYRMHDIIRNHFLKVMDDATRCRAHRAASRYFLELENDPARIEALHHLLSSGDTEGAMAHIMDLGRSLIKRGYAEELGGVLSLIDPEMLPLKLSAEYHHILGEVQHVMGEWDAAMESFSNALRVCDEIGDPGMKTRSNIMLARLMMLRGSSSDAIEMFRRTLDLSRANGQFMHESFAVRQLGSIYYLMGDNDNARTCHERSLEIARITRSKECLANAYFLGSLLKRLDGDNEGCERDIKAAMVIYDELGDTIQILKLINNLGWLYSMQERWEESLELMEEVLEMATSCSDLENIGYGLLNSADILIRLKRYDEAKERLEKAERLFRRLEDMRLISSTEFTFAQLHTATSEWDDAADHFDRSIEGYERLGIINQLPELYFYYGDMELDRGDATKAIELYSRAAAYAERMKDSPWVHRIRERVSGLHKD